MSRESGVQQSISTPRLYFATLELDRGYENLVCSRNTISMKAICYAILLSAVMSLPAMGRTCINASSEVAARHEIFRLLKERRDAFYRGDVDKFQDLEADDFTRVTEDGHFITKQEQMAYIQAQAGTLEALETKASYADHDLKLDIFCAIAVLTGVLTEAEPSQDGAKFQRSRFTEVWVFRHGRWKTLHNHYTSIVP